MSDEWGRGFRVMKVWDYCSFAFTMCEISKHLSSPAFTGDSETVISQRQLPEAGLQGGEEGKKPGEQKKWRGQHLLLKQQLL